MLAAGVVAGVGGEAKPQVLFVATVFALVLLAVGPRRPLVSWWGAGGVAAAVVLTVPYAVWQQIHGWPQLTVAGNIGGSAEGGRAGFIPFQLVMVSPFLVPVWVAGLLAPFRRAPLRSLRFVPIAYGALAVLYIVGNGKAYYLASLYPLLLGLGAVPVAAWTLRARYGAAVLWAAIGLSAAVSAVIALPLLPETSLQGSFVMAVNPDMGETVGWPAFADTVARAWHGSRLPNGGTPRSSRATTARRAPSICSAPHVGCRAPTAGTTGSASGGSRRRPTPGHCSSVTTGRPTRRRTSQAVGSWRRSTTGSASTTMSRGFRCFCAGSRSRGRSSGPDSRTSITAASTASTSSACFAELNVAHDLDDVSVGADHEGRATIPMYVRP